MSELTREVSEAESSELATHLAGVIKAFITPGMSVTDLNTYRRSRAQAERLIAKLAEIGVQAGCGDEVVALLEQDELEYRKGLETPVERDA